MKKKFMSFIIAAAMFISAMPAAFATVNTEQIINDQMNFDPFSETKAVEMYAYGPMSSARGTDLVINSNGYVGGLGSRDSYIVYKNMNFGSDGILAVEVETANKQTSLTDATKIEFRKNSKDGELIASFDKNNIPADTGGWETFK